MGLRCGLQMGWLNVPPREHVGLMQWDAQGTEMETLSPDRARSTQQSSKGVSMF